MPSKASDILICSNFYFRWGDLLFSRIREHLLVHCWYIFKLSLLVPTFSFSQYIRFIISKLSFFWRADDCGSSSGRPPGSHSSLSFLPRAFYPKGICRLNRVSPDLQNPHFKKQRKTFSLGRRCPSGRMRGGG